MNQITFDKGKKYSLHASTLERSPERSLSEKEFFDLKNAKSCLNAALALEENYDLLLQNYRELELEAISAAVTDMTSMVHDYEDFFEIRTAMNRRVCNLLSATRMYLDQYPKNLKKIGANLEPVKDVCSEFHDNFFEYRFMEALRNHVQHAGLAVHGVTMGGRWLPPRDPRKLEFSIIPYALKKELEGTDFKKRVLQETPDKVLLIHAARVHVGGISSVHKKVRESIKPFVDEARALFEAAIAWHGAEKEERYPSLSATAKEQGVVIERFSVFLDWDDIRQKLLNRNDSVENLANRFVTSQVNGVIDHHNLHPLKA